MSKANAGEPINGKPQKSHSKKILLNLLVAVVGILAALFLLEIGARFLPPPFENSTNAAESCWQPSGWRGNPNFQTTIDTEGYVHDLALNSKGMHDTEHPEEKPDDTFRVLMLGDSFVHAIQVKENETAHQVLENLLNSGESLLDFEVVSSGVSGWGTGQQLLYYREEGRQYRPDMVLLMMFIDNDFKDNLPGRGITVDGVNCYTPYFVLNGDTLDSASWLYAPGLTPAVGEGSTLKKVANNLLGMLYRYSALYAQLEPILPRYQPEFSMLDYYIGDNETFDYAQDLTYSLVDELHREVQNNDAMFAVVLISPTSLIEFNQMSADERAAVYQRLPALKRAEEIAPLNEAIATTLATNDVSALDLLPSFLQHIDQTGESLHFEQDKHWTTAGNRVAAETIYNWLIENEMLSLE